jgi:hypothetical protein
VLPQYLFLLLAQLVNLGYRAYSMRRLRSLEREEQLQQVRRQQGLAAAAAAAAAAVVVCSSSGLQLG